MRILQVIESFGAGSMQVALTISERLAEEGHSLALAHGRVAESPREPRATVAPAIELFELPWSRSPAAQPRVALGLRRLVRRWRPDVVHLHSSFAGAVGSLALGGTVPLVYTPHGYSFARSGQRAASRAVLMLAEHLVARRVDLVGVVSHAEAREAARIHVPRVEVVLNGIAELDDPRPYARASVVRPTVVAVGRVAPQRRPPQTADLLASVHDVADASWIGGGDEQLVETVRSRGVEVTGWLERDAALVRLSAADVCLHWSAWDAQPLAVLEAMARDVVVVASDIPANRELLGAQQVCATTTEAARLLREVLTSPQRRAELLTEQRRRRGRYSARRMAADWEAVYRRLARGGTE